MSQVNTKKIELKDVHIEFIDAFFATENYSALDAYIEEGEYLAAANELDEAGAIDPQNSDDRKTVKYILKYLNQFSREEKQTAGADVLVNYTALDCADCGSTSFVHSINEDLSHGLSCPQCQSTILSDPDDDDFDPEDDDSSVDDSVENTVKYENNVIQLFAPRALNATPVDDKTFADLIQKNKDRAAAVNLERNDYNMRVVSNLKNSRAK